MRKKEKPTWVFMYPRCFIIPTYVAGTVLYLYPYRYGFRGYGYRLGHVYPCHTRVPPYWRVFSGYWAVGTWNLESYTTVSAVSIKAFTSWSDWWSPDH